MNKTRVYLFTGFLESGKSSFIQDTLLEQGFGEDEKTLIIACEEGEVAFDIPALEKENASVEFIEIMKLFFIYIKNTNQHKL